MPENQEEKQVLFHTHTTTEGGVLEARAVVAKWVEEQLVPNQIISITELPHIPPSACNITVWYWSK